jgi:flavin-dependent dehydrogenase
VKKLLFDGGKVCGLKVESEGTHQEKDFRARIVIDATGASGVLRRQLPESSPIEREVAKEDMMVAWREIYETPDFEFPTPEILDIIWDQEQTLGGYTWVFPQGKNRVNVGCGVTTLPNHRQPKEIYESYVRNNWDFMKTKLDLLHSGGGMAPLRRPIDTLVDDNFMLVGDSGCQVNPVHGGGIGSSMLGGAHAGMTASEALERNDTSMGSLWAYNPRYMRSYGIKQASLDVFRWFLLNITNDDINYVFRKKIITGSDLLGVSMTGKMEMATGDKLKRLVSGAGKLALLRRVNRIAHLMEDIKVVYSEYPNDPKGLLAWKAKLGPIYDAAKRT